jgi:hypothetical protein
MNRLRNCPAEYYQNCKNQLSSCKICAAGYGPGSGKVFYQAISEDEALLKHPYEKDQGKSKRLKQAQGVERAVQREIIHGTIRSGAALGDGDHHLLKGTIRQEVKDRGSRKSWNLTWQEYEKGQRQGISVYAISIDCPDGRRRTMYMMESDLFTQFLALQKNDEHTGNPDEGEVQDGSKDRS